VRVEGLGGREEGRVVDIGGEGGYHICPNIEFGADVVYNSRLVLCASPAEGLRDFRRGQPVAFRCVLYIYIYLTRIRAGVLGSLVLAPKLTHFGSNPNRLNVFTSRHLAGGRWAHQTC